MVDLNRSQGLGGITWVAIIYSILGIRDISDDKLSKWKHLANRGDKKIRTNVKLGLRLGFTCVQ